MVADERSPLVGGSHDEGLSNTRKQQTPPLSARQAYALGDSDASQTYHDMKSTKSEEGHQEEGGFLKPIIFGGLDGILTSFAIVAGAAGGELSSDVVLILGFSNIFADALSMGVGEFLSSKANNEWVLTEREREVWEFENYPEGEIQEMIDIYIKKGLTEEDATNIVRTMAKYKDFFLDIMMTHELELQVPEENYLMESIKEGLVMFCSFAFFGALPLLGYVFIPLILPEWGADHLFITACIVTGVVLFFMGSVKSYVSSQHWLQAGLETLVLGGCCATVAYTIGQLIGNLAGETEG